MCWSSIYGVTNGRIASFLWHIYNIYMFYIYNIAFIFSSVEVQMFPFLSYLWVKLQWTLGWEIFLQNSDFVTHPEVTFFQRRHANDQQIYKRVLHITNHQFSSVQSLSRVRLFATPWIAARQASLSITNSQSSLRLTSIESVMPSSHLNLCRPLLLLPPVPPSIRVFSNESTLRMRWPKY